MVGSSDGRFAARDFPEPVSGSIGRPRIMSQEAANAGTGKDCKMGMVKTSLLPRPRGSTRTSILWIASGYKSENRLSNPRPQAGWSAKPASQRLTRPQEPGLLCSAGW